MTILRLILGQRGLVLNEGVMAYSTADGVFLPLGEVSRNLDFSIALDDAGLRAEGWYIDPQRRFKLDLEKCSVEVSRKKYRVLPSHIMPADGDIYVSTESLRAWFPLQFRVDASRLLVEIHAREKLPVERRLERRENWKDIVVKEDERRTYPVKEVPYRFWDWPFIDLTGEVFARGNSGAGTDLQHRYKLITAGDFMHMNTAFSATGDHTDGLHDVFLTLSRFDDGGNLLGPLNAREYVLGDLGVYQDQLVTNSVLGRGIRISSFPRYRPDEFHIIDLRGELPLGWDVELYQDDRLIGHHSGDDLARYDFTSIPLEYGLNEFRLVFYGPQGEVNEQTFRKVIGPGMVIPGEQHFRLTVMQERDDGRLTSRPADGRLLASYELGLTPDVSLGGGIKSLVLGDGRHNYGSINLNAALAGFFSTLEFSADERGGRAAAAAIFGRLAGMDIRAETAQFDAFQSERTLIGGPGNLQSRSSVRLNKWLPRWGSLHASLGASFSNEQWTEGRRAEAEARVAVSGYRWNLAQALDARWFRDSSGQVEELHNSLLFSTRLGSISLRGELDQEILPREQIHNIGASADWRISPDLYWQMGFNRQPIEHRNSYYAGLTWHYKYLALGSRLQITSGGDFIAGITVSSGFLRNPQDGAWRASATRRTQTAAAAVRVFLDKNDNGIWDKDEPLVPGAEVKASQTGAMERTDEGGLAFLPGLPVHQPLIVQVASESLENPFWIAEGAGRRLNLRPGRSAYVELPVVPAGVIEGKVYSLDTQGRRSTLASVPIRLFSSNSDLVQQTYSAYDGYFTFEGLRPGEYRVRISPTNTPAAEATEETVSLGGEQGMIQSMDLALRLPAPGNSGHGSLMAESRPNESAAGDTRSRGFTIQLVGMRSESAVKAFIDRHNIGDRAIYFATTYRGRPWYPVIYGRFDGREAARAALAGLPPPLLQASPWIRPLQGVPEYAIPTPPPAKTPTSHAAVEEWLNSPYTIQIIAMSSEDSIKAYMETHKLNGKAVYFESWYRGNPWFPVVYGRYESREQAESALGALPMPLRGAGPWIRSRQSIRDQLAELRRKFE